MDLKEPSGTRLTLLAKSFRNNLVTGHGRAVVAYRQSRPWHVMAYWLRSSSHNTSGWLKRMIAEQREWLRQPVHFRLPVRRAETPAASRPTILIGRDLTAERPHSLIQRPDSYGELLMENRRLRNVIDLLVRFGPNQLWGSHRPATGNATAALDLRL